MAGNRRVRHRRGNAPTNGAMRGLVRLSGGVLLCIYCQIPPREMVWADVGAHSLADWNAQVALGEETPSHSAVRQQLDAVLLAVWNHVVLCPPVQQRVLHLHRAVLRAFRPDRVASYYEPSSVYWGW